MAPSFVTHNYAILTARKKCPITVGKNRYKLSVCEVVGSSKRQGEEKKLRLRAKELSEERSCGQDKAIVMRKDGNDTLVYSKLFCGGKLNFINILMFIPHFTQMTNCRL